VEIEGDREHFFALEDNVEEEIIPVDNNIAETVELPTEVVARINQQFFDDDDLYLLRTLLEVDSDNDPAPENIPPPAETAPAATIINNECVYEQEWGHDGICQRRKTNVNNHKPKITFPASFTPTMFDLFESLFPKAYVTEVMLPLMNEKVQLGELLYGEFIRWIGLWFLIATIQGPVRLDFWRKEPVNVFVGAPFGLGE
jgi:hypothetical protein